MLMTVISFYLKYFSLKGQNVFIRMKWVATKGKTAQSVSYHNVNELWEQNITRLKTGDIENSVTIVWQFRPESMQERKLLTMEKQTTQQK